MLDDNNAEIMSKMWGVGSQMNGLLCEWTTNLYKKLINRHSNCEIYGFPLHIKTLDQDTIWERVKETRIWEHGGKDDQ